MTSDLCPSPEYTRAVQDESPKEAPPKHGKESVQVSVSYGMGPQRYGREPKSLQQLVEQVNKLVHDRALLLDGTNIDDGEHRA